MSSIVGWTLPLLLACSTAYPAASVADSCGSTWQVLVGRLRQKTVTSRRQAASELGYLGPSAKDAVPDLIRAADDPEPSVAAAAVEALGYIGPDAAAAVPKLVGRLGDPMYPGAARALARIDGPAIPGLTKVLTLGTLDARYDAAFALGRIGPGARAAVPALVEALKGDQRRAAAEALGRIGQRADLAVPALLGLLKDEDALHSMGDVIVRALTKLKAPPLAALAQAVSNRSPQLIDIYGHIGKDAGGLTPALRDALVDPDPEVRNAAVVALGRIGERAEAAVPAMIEAFQRNGRVDDLGAAALGRIGPTARAAIPIVLNALHEAGPADQGTFLWALTEIDPRGLESLPALLALLGEQHAANDRGASSLRVQACRAIGRIGSPAEVAVATLVTLLEAGDEDLASEAATSLGRIGPGARAAVPALVEALKGGRRRAAAFALGRIGPGARAAVPALVEALKRGEGIEHEVVVAIARINPGTLATVRPMIEERLGAVNNPYERALAMAALGHECPQDGVFVALKAQMLTELLDPADQDELGAWVDDVQETLESLADFGPAARSQVSQLNVLKGYPNTHVQRWVQETLSRILIK